MPESSTPNLCGVKTCVTSKNISSFAQLPAFKSWHTIIRYGIHISRSATVCIQAAICWAGHTSLQIDMFDTCA